MTRTAIEKLGYIVGVHEQGGGFFRANAYAKGDWTRDRSATAKTEQEALAALWKLVELDQPKPNQPNAPLDGPE